MNEAIPKPIVEPTSWPDDGTDRREPVVDPSDGRIIRWVGWRQCMCCRKRFFSSWVTGRRICEPCKTGQTTAKNPHVADMTPTQLERTVPA